jgi:ERCC4-type nuclease
MDRFLVARNPDDGSTLPYLVYVPVEGGMWLKARETWPRASRVYCHPATDVDVATLEILESVPVLSCARRGPVVDLVLERGQNRRAQFVFTSARGRAMIFWQTAKAAASARPGLRVPNRAARALDRITIDTRERYGYTFKGQNVTKARLAMPAGDYGAWIGNALVAVVERKAIDDFCTSLVDGTLGFVMVELARFRVAAVVVEGTYTQILRRGFVDGAWLAELLARLQVRYPTVSIVFAETRTLGERWTYEFFRAAATEYEPDPVADQEPVAQDTRPKRKRTPKSTNRVDP